MFYRAKSGQTLIEIVVVTGILALLLTAVMSVVTISVRRNRIAQEQAEATNLTNEAVEWFRDQKNQFGWNEFHEYIEDQVGVPGTQNCYCLGNSPPDVSSLPTDLPICDYSDQCTPLILDNTSYYRGIQITNDSSSQVSYEVSTEWNRGGPTQTSTAKGALYKRYEGN